jgi:hypothetical protein
VGYRLGVDLGTTYTAAAVHVDGRVEMLGLGIRAMQVPSVVFVRRTARSWWARQPSSRARPIHRGWCGSSSGASATRFRSSSAGTVLGQALTARLLAWVVGVATERQGGPPEHVCVTHPANWGPFKRDLLGQAVGLAACVASRPAPSPKRRRSPTRRATGWPRATGSRCTTWVAARSTRAVLARDGAGFRLAGPPEGVEQLGGIDFDEAVFRHVLTSLGPEVADLDDMDPATATALARLRRDCVEAKEVLSFSIDTVVPVALPGITKSVRLTRGDLDDMLRPAIAETVSATRRVLDSAGVDPSDLAAIVLVGGSSRSRW